MKQILVVMIFVFGLAGCGVKGKPLPPLDPAEIGRGAPTYKGAAEMAKPDQVPAAIPVRPSPKPRTEP